jgi:nitrogen-specific signal transduction histidine kinase
MGLPIAKAIMGTHGGIIGVVSQLGQGSVFSISPPIYSNLRFPAKFIPARRTCRSKG